MTHTFHQIAGRTIRVDHVADYKAPKPNPDATPEEIEQERQRRNMILPPHLRDDASDASEESEQEQLPSDIEKMDPEDPMRDMLISKWRKKQKKKKKKRKD